MMLESLPLVVFVFIGYLFSIVSFLLLEISYNLKDAFINYTDYLYLYIRYKR